MAKTAVYGIESIKFADVVTGGFPTSYDGFDMKAIVKDSVEFNDEAPSVEDIEVEDMEEYYASLPSDKGSQGFTVQTYDLGADAYAYFYGYTENSETGYYDEDPDFTLDNKAVQITTKAFGDFPSRVFEWANMLVTVSKSGTIGKSGFPNLTLELKKQTHTDSDGNVVVGARWKNADSTE